ncbi:radical SAM protein [Actinoplanes sp. NPDC051475]|uniref:radical SAM protein n=1 Tax=Actinoplanes sp. NPDC051475 TaxID=3157225 RepID=UPI00344B31FD
MQIEINWDVTYACPLRCVHCYSESGRRPARQLSHAELLETADALVGMKPRAVTFGGGEPLLVPRIVEVAERISRAGIEVSMYTGGWPLDPDTAQELVRVLDRVNVSVDGATAAVHDRIRGRRGSFDRAVKALELFDAAAAATDRPFTFGLDCVLVQSNLHQLDEVCALTRRFPRLSFAWFGAAIPSGLASRAGFADRELLTDDQLRELTSRDTLARLRTLVPAGVRVATTDNRALQMHPDMMARFDFSMMQVEPDGEVRAMPIYEGTVGNVRTDPLDVLWERSKARWKDPFITEALSTADTMADWAAATRRIDERFGSDEVRARIARRPEFGAVAVEVSR